jgi:hypothetical protein
MSVRFACPNCRTTLKAPAGTEGKRSRCPHCNRMVDVPLPPVPAKPTVAAPIAPAASRALPADNRAEFSALDVLDVVPAGDGSPILDALPAAAPAEPVRAIVAKGVDGEVELLGNRVAIRRRGFFGAINHGFGGDQELLASSITAIQFKPAGPLLNGYIRFGFAGGQQQAGGIFGAIHDDNCVAFNQKQQPAFERFKRELDRSRQQPVQHSTQPAVDPRARLDALEKLADLRAKGIVTEAEFQEQKRKLLG